MRHKFNSQMNLFSPITPVRRRIVDYVKAKGEATGKELAESLRLTEEEFKREFAVLRHMEVLRGKEGLACV